MVQIHSILTDLVFTGVITVYLYFYSGYSSTEKNRYDDFFMALSVVYILLRVSIFLFPLTDANKKIQEAYALT